MIALEDLAGMEHAEAKLAIHRSPVWAGERAAKEGLEDAMFRALDREMRRNEG
jgi:hypothetical protein